ncbi:hypothetical protein [Lysinibacter cavernae]|uniref:Uncharacterized protein n=1 Tax=Lysinibacter cavernae TaxID=1640652 RepID=A0A7X5R0S8_9MICO|nr:hypothetical protein [Lysinibacter cavernae]NIH53491.1 hypothetical protein [Lysinibacter cavernae]
MNLTPQQPKRFVTTRMRAGRLWLVGGVAVASLIASGLTSVTPTDAAYTNSAYGMSQSVAAEIPMPPVTYGLGGGSYNETIGYGVTSKRQLLVWGAPSGYTGEQKCTTATPGCTTPANWNSKSENYSAYGAGYWGYWSIGTPPTLVSGMPEVKNVVGTARGLYVLDYAGRVIAMHSTYQKVAYSPSTPYYPYAMRVGGTPWAGTGTELTNAVSIAASRGSVAVIANDRVYYSGSAYAAASAAAPGANTGEFSGFVQMPGLPDPSVFGNRPIALDSTLGAFYITLESGAIYQWIASSSAAIQPGAMTSTISATKINTFAQWEKKPANTGATIVKFIGNEKMSFATLSNGTALYWIKGGVPALLPGVAGVKDAVSNAVFTGFLTQSGSLIMTTSQGGWANFPQGSNVATVLASGAVSLGPAGYGFLIQTKNSSGACSFKVVGNNAYSTLGTPYNNPPTTHRVFGSIADIQGWNLSALC